MRTVHMKIDYPGDLHVDVYRPRAKNPHFSIIGADIKDLDKEKVAEYMYGCDWIDRNSKGWVHPCLRCDDFMKT